MIFSNLQLILVVIAASVWSLQICSGPCVLENVGPSRFLISSPFLLGCAPCAPNPIYVLDRSHRTLRIRGGCELSHEPIEKLSVEESEAKETKKKRKSKSKPKSKIPEEKDDASDSDVTEENPETKEKKKKKKRSGSKSQMDWETWRKLPKGKSRYGTDVIAGSGPMLYQV